MARRHPSMLLTLALFVSAAAFADSQYKSYDGKMAGFARRRWSFAHTPNNSQTKDEDPPRREPNEALRQSIQNIATVLNSTRTLPPSLVSETKGSVVHIIGTGLTPSLFSLPLETLHILSQADVVLHDSLGLSHQDICTIVPRHCQVVCVGKRGDGANSWKQDDIDHLLLRVAMQQHTAADEALDILTKRPKTIVRLKGGDPFLFGRTRSEIEILRANDISYTYTPSISSCIAGPHLGGIPLTDARLNCQSFGVYSGTDSFGLGRRLKDDGADFSNVDVLVFLMIGRLDKLEGLCNLLVFGRNTSSPCNGRKWNENTPCAVIQNAGGISEKDLDVPPFNTQRPIQRVWRSTLGNIVPMIRSEDETRTSVSPAVFVVGKVCELDLLNG